MTDFNRPTYYYEPTAEELEAVAKATPEQVAEAFAECVTDPNFWLGLVEAFCEGLERGARRY